MFHRPSFLPRVFISFRVPTLVGVAGLLLFCGGGGSGGSSSGPQPPPPNTIFVGGTSGGGYGDTGTPILAFNPVNLTVPKGTTVTWDWQSGGHLVDSGPGCAADNQFSSGGVKSAGFSMTHTFNTAGTYPFFCGVHCVSNMKGTITVTP